MTTINPGVHRSGSAPRSFRPDEVGGGLHGATRAQPLGTLPPGGHAGCCRAGRRAGRPHGGRRHRVAPVLAALRSTLEECATIRTAAEEWTLFWLITIPGSRQRVAHAEEQAQRLLAQFQLEAPAERAVSAAAVRQSGQAAAEQLLADATEEARRLRERAADRLPAVVDHVVALVRADLLGEEPR
jgi:vacuolar-type H+-ATPase subunit H